MWSSGDGEEYRYYLELGKATDLNVYKANEDSFAQITIGEETCSRDNNGISIVMYVFGLMMYPGFSVSPHS